MAVMSSTSDATRKVYRRQAIIWLMMTLLLGVITTLIWMASQTPTVVETKIQNSPIAYAPVSIEELKQPLSIEALHELDNDVQPIDFSETVRDLRDYPDEFKDKRYLSANKGKWTVQVMNVAENDVIVSYLEGRADRKKFAYFRYSDENKQTRYMLTYGLLSSPQEAVGASKLIDFGLPDDVRVLAEEINRYVSIIDNYERPEPIKDLSSKRTRSVNLQPTQREVPVREQKPTTEETSTKPTTQQKQESIRQSKDTSATLAVNEDRKVVNEGESAPKSEESKPPVVAAPKPPASASSDSSSGNSSGSSNKKGKDSIKELIEEKTE